MQYNKHLLFASFLLLTTSLTPAAYAACPTSSAGTITVTGASTKCTVSGTLNVTSTGVISETAGDGVFVPSSVFASAINNAGTIEGSGYGINLFERAHVASITNDAGGIIRSTGSANGIFLGNLSSVGTITNSGTISSIRMFDNAEIGDIVNHGTIEGGNIGIDVDEAYITGSIVNDGRIRGTNTGISLSEGDIVGGITNNGYIGGADYSIYIEDSDNPIIIDNYGELDGDVYIYGSTLNLNAGTIMRDAIDGSDGIVNLNTDLSTSAGYGQNESLLEINIASGKKLSALSNNGFAAQNFNNYGTLSVLEGQTVTITGNYYQDPTAILRVQANSLTNYGKLQVDGDATLTNSAVFVDVTNGANFANNTLLTNVISATGTLDANGLTISDNSTLFNFSTQISGNNVNLVVAADSTTSVEKSVVSQNNNAGKGAARVLDTIIAASPTGDMSVVRDALGTLTSEAAVSHAVSQTLPTLAGGSTTAIMQTMNTTNQVVQARQSQNIGLSSGDEFIVNHNLWFKPFGSWANQDTKNNITGYKSDSYGLVAGADRALDDSWRLGLALTYARTNVNSYDDLNELNVDSYQSTIYSSYTVDPRTEANFQLSLGYNKNDSTRIIDFGGLRRTAEGDFGSYSLNAGAGIARRYDAGANSSFVPSIRLDYNRLTNESYTEEGAGALNLNVKSQTSDQLIPTVQAKFDYDVSESVTVSMLAGIGYDLLNSANSVTSSYVGGGSAFATKGLRMSPWTVRSGLGLTYKPTDAYDITLRYDREDRGSEFDNQSVTAKLRMPF